MFNIFKDFKSIILFILKIVFCFMCCFYIASYENYVVSINKPWIKYIPFIGSFINQATNMGVYVLLFPLSLVLLSFLYDHVVLTLFTNILVVFGNVITLYHQITMQKLDEICNLGILLITNKNVADEKKSLFFNLLNDSLNKISLPNPVEFKIFVHDRIQALGETQLIQTLLNKNISEFPSFINDFIRKAEIDFLRQTTEIIKSSFPTTYVIVGVLGVIVVGVVIFGIWYLGSVQPGKDKIIEEGMQANRELNNRVRNVAALNQEQEKNLGNVLEIQQRTNSVVLKRIEELDQKLDQQVKNITDSQQELIVLTGQKIEEMTQQRKKDYTETNNNLVEIINTQLVLNNDKELKELKTQVEEYTKLVSTFYKNISPQENQNGRTSDDALAGIAAMGRKLANLEPNVQQLEKETKAIKREYNNMKQTLQEEKQTLQEEKQKFIEIHSNLENKITIFKQQIMQYKEEVKKDLDLFSKQYSLELVELTEAGCRSIDNKKQFVDIEIEKKTSNTIDFMTTVSKKYTADLEAKTKKFTQTAENICENYTAVLEDKTTKFTQNVEQLFLSRSILKKMDGTNKGLVTEAFLRLTGS